MAVFHGDDYEEYEYEETEEQYFHRTSVQKLAELYYKLPGNDTGGILHVVLDDGNLEDDHIRSCMENAVADGDYIAYNIGTLLLHMPEWQRERLYKQLDR